MSNTIGMDVAAKAIDEMLLRVVKIHTLAGARPLTNATGFFFLQDRYLYVVTARHVVVDEANGHYPDHLKLSLHSTPLALRLRCDLSIPLYIAGSPQWQEHPTHGRATDLVAILINDPHVLDSRFISTFTSADCWSMEDAIPLGQSVLILGFPLGFHDDVNNLPIVRSATIASSYSHPFKGESYFLTDARLHRGMSGAPVIANLAAGSGRHGESEASWRLFGMHSSTLDVSDRDPEQDERLALNTTWYASLITEMLPTHDDAIDFNCRDKNSSPRRREM